ncbi:MAG: DctP family TRAP transporter solute-binding subunit [Oligoflexales bacterium]
MNKKYILVGFSCLIVILAIFAKLLIKSNKALVLKFGHDMPVGTPQHDGAVKFKELLEEASKGAIKIEIHPNQTLGTDPEMVEMVQRGELAFTIPPTSKISSLAPNLDILDIPYLFPSQEKLYEALDGAFGESLFHQLRRTGIEPIVMWESGYKNFTANKSISTPTDFAGLRFRIMPSDTLVAEAISLNAFPENVDFHKIRVKLATGEIDSQENPISSIYAMKIFEEQTHLMLSRHGYLGQLFIASKKMLSKLQAPQRELVVKAAKQAAKYQRSRISFYEDRFLAKIEKAGLKIIPYSEKMKALFVESFAPIYYENRLFLREFKDNINPLILPFMKPHAAIGLNLSFSYPASDSALAIKRGAELAVDEVNAAGGVLGRPMILLTKTHDGFPRKGIKNLKKFSEDESVIAFLGGMHSPVVLAERETVNQLRIPYLIPWAAATPIIHKDNPYIFRFSVRDADAAERLVNTAVKLGTKVALILEDTGWGKSNETSIKNEISKKSQIVMGETYWFDWGEKDFSEILNKVYSSTYDVIIFVGNSPEGVHLVKGVGQKDRKIPIISHWGITGGRFWHEAKDILPSVDLRFLKTFDMISDDKAASFRERYYKKYKLSDNSYIPASFGSIHSYELIKILAEAIKTSNSLSPQDISNGILRFKKYQGLFSEYKNIFSIPGREREALSSENISFGYYDERGNIRHNAEK